MIHKLVLAKRYAKIFLNGKITSDDILTLAAEIQFIAVAIKANSFILEFLSNPVILNEQKLQVIQSFVRQGGFSPYTRSLLELLIKKNRAELIPVISSELHKVADVILNRIRVKLTTAVEPSVFELEDVSQKIGRFFGKKVFVERHINPSIIGGFILEGDGKLIDLSVMGQLKRLLLKK